MRILLVEDDRDASQSLEMILQLAGHTVASAEGGATALALAAQEKFDLVMVDHCMPGMDGAMFLQALRQMPGWADVPVILATGIVQEDADRVLASVTGPVELLRKPYEPALLLERLKQIKAVRAHAEVQAELPPSYPPAYPPDFIE